MLYKSLASVLVAPPVEAVQDDGLVRMTCLVALLGKSWVRPGFRTVAPQATEIVL